MLKLHSSLFIEHPLKTFCGDSVGTLIRVSPLLEAFLQAEICRSCYKYLLEPVKHNLSIVDIKNLLV